MTKKIKKQMVMAVMAVVLGCMTFASCNKENTMLDESTSFAAPCSKGKFELNDHDRTAFAQDLMARIGSESISFFKTINEGIDKVTSYGLDEFLTFFDILDGDKSVFLSTISQQMEKFAPILIDTSFMARYNLNCNNHYRGLQFYWPYHDEWDKKTMPLLCFAPADPISSTAIAFHFKDGALEKYLVDVKKFDPEKIPIVIINLSETDYDDYPSFKDGIFSKNGVDWYNPKMVDLKGGVTDNSSSSNRVFEARSCSLTSSGTQYDLFWAGGSEFELVSVYATDNSHLEVSSKARVEFTRKEIKNKKTKTFGLTLHNDWQPGLGDIYLHLSEQDAWGFLDTIDIGLNILGNTLSTSIFINSTDDKIYDGKITRSNFFNRCEHHDGEMTLGGETLNCALEIYDNQE